MNDKTEQLYVDPVEWQDKIIAGINQRCEEHMKAHPDEVDFTEQNRTMSLAVVPALLTIVEASNNSKSVDVVLSSVATGMALLLINSVNNIVPPEHRWTAVHMILQQVFEACQQPGLTTGGVKPVRRN
jgi:hypothetical protein